MKNSVERKENISNQLKKIGLSFNIFTAIDGREKPLHPLISKYSKELSFKYKGQYLTPGQLGCYASHYLLWEKCVALNESIIIIEDDADIYTDNFSNFITNIHSLSKNIECIRLFKNKRNNFTSKYHSNCSNIEIHQFSRGHMSATGYYLTPTGAKKLLNNSNQWYLPVDIYMDQFWVNHIICYGTVPPCLTNDAKFESDIGYAKKKKLTFLGKLNREIFNLSETIRRYIFNLKNYK